MYTTNNNNYDTDTELITTMLNQTSMSSHNEVQFDIIKFSKELSEFVDNNPINTDDFETTINTEIDISYIINEFNKPFLRYKKRSRGKNQYLNEIIRPNKKKFKYSQNLTNLKIQKIQDQDQDQDQNNENDLALIFEEHQDNDVSSQNHDQDQVHENGYDADCEDSYLIFEENDVIDQNQENEDHENEDYENEDHENYDQENEDHENYDHENEDHDHENEDHDYHDQVKEQEDNYEMEQDN